MLLNYLLTVTFNYYHINLVTCSIARSSKHRYLSYSEGDFESFCTTGAICCTDWGEIWSGAVPLFKGIGPPKLKILLKFYLNFGI